MKTWIHGVPGRAFLPIALTLFGAGLLGCATGRGRGATPMAAPACDCPCARKSGIAQPPLTGITPAGPPALESAVVPATAKDPIWGSLEAPVTIVEFSDFQCPFCARVDETLAELRQLYGPDRLRLVWKNYPLPFHNDARPTAEAAMTVFAMGGADAFWRFQELAFADQGESRPRATYAGP